MVLSYADGLPYKYPVMVRSYTNLIEVMDTTRNIEKDIVICNGTAGWRGEKRQQEGLFESSKKKKCHQEKKKLLVEHLYEVSLLTQRVVQSVRVLSHSTSK